MPRRIGRYVASLASHRLPRRLCGKVGKQELELPAEINTVQWRGEFVGGVVCEKGSACRLFWS